MKDLELLAMHARVVENRLRRDFGQYHPLVEIEVTPDGFNVKAVAGDGTKVFSAHECVPFEEVESLGDAIDNVGTTMNKAMS